MKGRDLFDMNLFRDPISTTVFYTFMAELKLLSDAAYPSLTHHVICRLRERGQLLRCYTQNIDGLEVRAGLEADLDACPVTPKNMSLRAARLQQLNSIIPLHGDLRKLFCMICARPILLMLNKLSSLKVALHRCAQPAFICPICVRLWASEPFPAAR